MCPSWNGFWTFSLPVYPQNFQFNLHVGEFLRYGYRCNAEAIECKFPKSDGGRGICPGSVGVSDGFLKVLMIYGIVVICHKLETWPNCSFLYKAQCIHSGADAGAAGPSSDRRDAEVVPVAALQLHSLRESEPSLLARAPFLGQIALGS